MGLLTTADLTMMRAAIAEMFPDTCNVLSESVTPDGQGGITSSWGTATTGMPCRIDDINTRATNQLPVVANGVKTAHQYQLSFPYSGTVNAGNRIESGRAAYTVVSVNTDQSWLAVGRAMLEYIEAITPVTTPSLNFSIASNSQYLGAIY